MQQRAVGGGDGQQRVGGPQDSLCTVTAVPLPTWPVYMREMAGPTCPSYWAQEQPKDGDRAVVPLLMG